MKQVNFRMHEIEKQRLQDIADFVGLSQGRSLAYLIERYYRTHEKQIVAFRAVMAQAQERCLVDPGASYSTDGGE